jgi:hypothetical protein
MNWQTKATQTVEKIYAEFLEEIIKAQVLKNRCTRGSEFGRELNEKEKKQISQGELHDPRIVRLMSISGKGGGKTAEEIKQYGVYHNVTLLDHLLSVVRGSLMLAALDWLSRNPDMDTALLERKLYVMAIVAFMHDLDKDLREQRIKDIESVTDEQVAERMTTYGINTFLNAKIQFEFKPEQLLYLIDKVESQQANRRLPAEMPPHFTDGALPLYVRMADKLDGAWLLMDYRDRDAHKQKTRIDRVLDWLKTDKSCIRSELLRNVFDNLDHTQVIDIFDPHHPFLLDELQRHLSAASRDIVGIPPLFEVHHDGRLVMLFLTDAKQIETIKAQGIEYLCDRLPFNLDLFIGSRDEEIYLVNQQPNHTQLNTFISEKLIEEKLKKLFRVKSSYKGLIDERLYDLLDDYRLSPIFQEKILGQTMMLYASTQSMINKTRLQLKKAAHLILLLNLGLQLKPKSKDGIPNYEEREKQLLQLIQQPRPPWIAEQVIHGHSRRVITGLWALTVAIEDRTVEQNIWGENGLLQVWLEGTETQKGFNQFMAGEDNSVITAVTTHFGQLFSGKLITASNENDQGRCLFTDQPVPFENRIESKMGLKKIGINANAFSGRDYRPEDLDFAAGHNNISLISYAEYKLRADMHSQSQRSNQELDLPTLIYSPATIGLFGGLGLPIDKSINQMSLEQLSEFEVSKSSITGTELYIERYRITRLEYIPSKAKEQIEQLKKLLTATLRIGRPIHIFRGLPSVNPAFFYYDAIPAFLAWLISDTKEPVRELRLEQIPVVLQRLELAELLIKTFGYGYNAVELYAQPQTRFKGICRAWCALAAKHGLIGQRLLEEYDNYFSDGELNMNENVQLEDGVMVKLGKAAAMIQKYPKNGWEASNNEQTIVFKICMDGLEQALKVPKPQKDRLSLVNGIADQLMQILDRRNLVAASEHRERKTFADACLAVAEIFVKDFWQDVMNERFPSQDNLRILASIYRMSFMRRAKKQKTNETEETQTETLS